MALFGNSTDYLRALEKDPKLAIMTMQDVATHRGVSRAAIDRMLRLNQLKEIRIGKTRYVRAWSVIDLRKERDEQVARVREFLEEMAHKRKILTYDPVMSLIGLTHTVPADRNHIGNILGSVSEQTWAENKTLLSVIVHRKTQGKTRPGPGFFNLVESLGILWDNEDEFLERETNKVWDIYAG